VSNNYVDISADEIGKYFVEGKDLLKAQSFKKISKKRKDRKQSKGKPQVRSGKTSKVRNEYTKCIHKCVKNHFRINLLKPLYEENHKNFWKNQDVEEGIAIVKDACAEILMNADVPNIDERLIVKDVKENLRCLLKPPSTRKRPCPGGKIRSHPSSLSPFHTITTFQQQTSNQSPNTKPKMRMNLTKVMR
jgi:hypothetical protein